MSLDTDFNGHAIRLPIVHVSHEADAKGIAVHNLTLMVRGEAVVRDVSFELKPGERLIVEGQSGSGSTLLKAIGELWRQGTGDIVLPTGAKPLLVPQKAYFPIETMRGIVSYPGDEHTFTDAQIADALTAVGMESVIPDLDNKDRKGNYWEKQMQPAEQQRIIFARILLHKPRMLMVDEISSALDEETEKQLYQLLIERLPDLILISNSHHKEIVPMHTHQAKIVKGQLVMAPVGSPLPIEAAASAPNDTPPPDAPQQSHMPHFKAPGLMRFLRAFA